MKLSVNSPSSMRLKALASLVNEGETTKYAAGVYGVPYTIARDYIAGLSELTSTNTAENDKSILPYIIVLKGNFVDGFEYLLTGGRITGDAWSYSTYAHAHSEALGWIEFDSLDAMILNI